MTEGPIFTDDDRIVGYSVRLGRLDDAGQIHMGMATHWAKNQAKLRGISYADALQEAVETLEAGQLLPPAKLVIDC